MEKYFTISEISKLFGIGPDSLRYYEEIALLTPKRGPNNYRYYRLSDMYRLNIISELRKLHFSMEQIKEYLDRQTLNHTAALLQNGKDEIKKEITRLKKQSQALDNQLHTIAAVRSAETNLITIKTLPARYAVQLATDFTIDEEFDFSIRCLLKKYGFTLHQFSDLKIGAAISLQDVQNGVCGKYLSVFAVQEEASSLLKDEIPAGDYLCRCYRGSYRNLPQHIDKLLDYAQEHKLHLDKVIDEFYLIDNRYTVQPEEFLTEIQIRIL